MKSSIKGNFKWRRYLAMVVGIIIMGLGVSIFKFSLTGNDPCNAVLMATADFIGIPYAFVAWGINLLWFVIEISFGRKYIGAGTFVNWFGVGVVATGFNTLINRLFVTPDNLVGKIVVLIIGVLVLSFSCSLYQTADVGIAPYDSIAIILNERTKIPYFWCRIFTDGLCAIIAWRLGGIVGLGTLVCALGLGPFISMYDKLVSKKLVGE